MLVIQVKDNETIDKALKRFKKKFEKTGVLKQVRTKAFYEKPSMSRRNAKSRSSYKQKMILQENN